MPLAAEIFPHNRTDLSTLNKIINRTRKLGATDVCFIFDSNEIEKEKLEELKNADISYITGGKIRAVEKIKYIPELEQFNKLTETLHFKELTTMNGYRSILCFDSEEAKSDQILREKLLTRLNLLLPAINSGDKNPCVLTDHPILKNFCEKDNDGFYLLNEKKIHEEKKYDGFFILKTYHPTLKPEKMILPFKKLKRVQNRFKSMKSFVEINSYSHWKENRIEGHIYITLLSYIIKRWLEIKTELSWENIETEYKKIKAITFKSEENTYVHRTKTNSTVIETLKLLNMKYPNLILKITYNQ